MKGRRKRGAGAESAEADSGESVESAHAVADALEPEPEAAPVSPPMARAAELAARGDLSEAAEAYADLAAADPDNLEALLGYGAALLGLVQYDAAEKEFRKALRLAPGNPQAHYQLGLTLYRRGNYAAAAAQLARAVELDPDLGPAYVVLGEALNQTGDPEGAVDALEEALRLQPENGRAFYALGIAHDRRGQPERAAEMYRRSREVGGR